MAAIFNRSGRYEICRNCPHEYIHTSPARQGEVDPGETDPEALNLVAYCVHERACLRAYAFGVQDGTDDHGEA